MKEEGNTEAERYLAALADRSFLNLWSFPNPYRYQKRHDKGDGKELCDLLVVCDPHIIIFSEKTIAWPNGGLKLAWSRWSKRAILSAANQARGAERWISEFPELLFLDRKCTKPFPIDLPEKEKRQIHRVVVANGSADACRTHVPGSFGSLIISSNVVGPDHWSVSNEPFVVGDIDPDGSFVHVFNEAALDIVMSELDTISDFTDYLAKKEVFVRSGQLLKAYGEENLLAYYAVRTNKDGDHDFVVEPGSSPVLIEHGLYDRLVSDPRYQAKKQADQISYLWDRLIETFTNHMLDGTSITLDGQEFDLRMSELAVRHMALVPRFVRRAHAQGIAGALRKGSGLDRNFRVMLSPADSKHNETAFFLQTAKFLDSIEEEGGYELYRSIRTAYAQVYAKGLLERYSHLKRVVGISREPLGQGRGVSEDLVYAEQTDWTQEDRLSIRKDCERFGVLQNTRERPWQAQEFPDNEETVTLTSSLGRPSGSQVNRKQRRAMNAKRRKQR